MLLLLAALGLAGGRAQAASRAWQGVVTHVTDGDTVWVQPAAGGPARKVRIVGIDAPEICQAHGVIAREALAAQLQARTVRVRGRGGDSYGRLLARLEVQGQDVGQWMVWQGHAWSDRNRHGTAGSYATQEMEARQARRGLWRERALAPSVFRRRHGSCHAP